MLGPERNLDQCCTQKLRRSENWNCLGSNAEVYENGSPFRTVALARAADGKRQEGDEGEEMKMFDRSPELDRDPSRANLSLEIPCSRPYARRPPSGVRPTRGPRTVVLSRTLRACPGEVGICRSVSFRDLAEAHFGGHPYTARRTVNRWIRQGLMREHTAKGPKGGSFQVLTLTGRGVREKPGGRPLSGVWTPNNGPGPGRSSAPS